MPRMPWGVQLCTPPNCRPPGSGGSGWSVGSGGSVGSGRQVGQVGQVEQVSQVGRWVRWVMWVRQVRRCWFEAKLSYFTLKQTAALFRSFAAESQSGLNIEAIMLHHQWFSSLNISCCKISATNVYLNLSFQAEVSRCLSALATRPLPSKAFFSCRDIPATFKRGFPPPVANYLEGHSYV